MTELQRLREKKSQLEKECSLRQKTIKDNETQSEFTKAEMGALQKELSELSNVPNQARSQLPAAESQSHEVLSPGTACEYLRRISDANLVQAESELNEVLKQLEQDTNEVTGRIKKRQIFVLILLLVVFLVYSPGLLMSLRSMGIVDIKQGTLVSRSVLAWEVAFDTLHASIKAYISKAVVMTACVLAPPPPAYKFSVRYPPLRAYHNFNSTETELVLVGEASLRVCSYGTSEQSFLRRDDCDGCLCAAGSVWIHYKDMRFFGKDGESCVSEKQWGECYSWWACCKHKPNFCWEFLWNGGRRTEGTDEESPKVLVDSCSMHAGCYVLIRRYRQWVVISDYEAASTSAVEERRLVGVALDDMIQVNKTLHLNGELRGWGLPSSAQYLLKLGPHSPPSEWQAAHTQVASEKQEKGKRYITWQLVSRYQIVASDHSGVEHEMASWKQNEWKSFRDDASRPRR